ncbi:MAG: hypothetical protein ABIR91_01180, partial [Candidatus Saccharimonadales bacterium]
MTDRKEKLMKIIESIASNDNETAVAEFSEMLSESVAEILENALLNVYTTNVATMSPKTRKTKKLKKGVYGLGGGAGGVFTAIN